MGKVPGNRKGWKSHIIKQVWKEVRKQLTVGTFCRALQLPRSTFYRWLHTVDRELSEIEEQIIEVCHRHRQRYGYRRVTAVLKRNGLSVNHKKVLRIMREYQILSKVRRKKKVYVGGAEPVVCPNILQRNFMTTAPNQKWFTDITYLTFGEKTLYLSTIMDAFNREIISWVVGESPTVHLAIKTLRQALEGKEIQGLILHSDQGGTYTSKEFQMYAKENGIITSMSRKGNCHDNAMMESFFSHFKCEAFYSQEIKTISNTTVREIVLEYMHYYNHVRIQGKLNNLSPVEYGKQVA